MKLEKENELYQMVIYLSPGDYHRFHSPTEMTLRKANHIEGHLYPVKLSYI
jgi:phosphatidylserine decarboxylase